MTSCQRQYGHEITLPPRARSCRRWRSETGRGARREPLCRRARRELGTKLVDRTTRRSSPTDAGRRLHARAGAILDALVEAEAELQQTRSSVEGLVRVALPPALVTRALLHELEQLLRAQPRLRVDLRIGSSQLPGEGGIDVLVLPSRPAATLSLISRRVVAQGWGLAASPAYAEARGLPKSPADLAKHACLRFSGERRQRTWPLTGPRGKRVAAHVDGAFECDDTRVLGDAIYAGLGIGVRPESEILEAIRASTLVRVLPGWRFGEIPMYLLTTAGRRGLPRVTAIMHVLADTIRGIG